MPFLYFSNTILCQISSRSVRKQGAASNPKRFGESLRCTLSGRNSKFTIVGKSS